MNHTTKKIDFTKKQTKQIISLRKKRWRVSDIAEKFGCSTTPIYSVLKKNGVSTKSTLYHSDEKKNLAIKLYKEGKSSREVSKLTKIDQSQVIEIVKKAGIETRNSGYFNWDRIYTLNEEFFDKIDTPEKAYVLGLFYTDGCNHLNLNTKNYGFSLALHKDDGYLLEKVNSLLGTNKPLVERGNKACCVIIQSSRRICENLINLGCLPAKSLNIQFPTEKQVPDELLSHFFRGLIDGDGCVWVSKDNKKACVIISSGSVSFINSIYHHLKYIFNIKSSISLSTSKKNPNSHQIRIYSKPEIEKVYNLFYKDNDLCLVRKKNKLINYLKG